MIYLHETTDVRPECVEEFAPSLAEHYRPAMEDAGARMFALWETVPATFPWPRFICLWELDDIAAVGSLLGSQYKERRPQFSPWRAELGRLCTRTEGRILTPSEGTNTLADLHAKGLSVAVCVHEYIETKQNQAENYCRQLERTYAPHAATFKRILIGTYHEVWNNREAINILALAEPWTLFPSGTVTANDVGAGPGVESWIVMSVGLRDGYHSGLIRQVDL